MQDFGPLMFFYGPPLASAFVSIIYFLAANQYSLGTRILISLHGAAISCWFLLLLYMGASGVRGATAEVFFFSVAVVPLGLVVYALVAFDGRGVHVLQIVNFVCALCIAVWGKLGIGGL